MKGGGFEWDDAKAAANLQAHGVSFEEAATVFESEMIEVQHDPDHSDDEDRWVAFGISTSLRFLFVNYTDRPETISIISARLMTPSMRRNFMKDQL